MSEPLTPEQRRILAPMTPEQRGKLACMVTLHEQWQASQRARIETLAAAVALVELGTLTVTNACTALGISRDTWYRYRRSLRPVPGSDLESEVITDIDRTLRAAGADESTTVADIRNSPDMELALAAIGVHVHHRVPDQEQ